MPSARGQFPRRHRPLDEQRNDPVTLAIRQHLQRLQALDGCCRGQRFQEGIVAQVLRTLAQERLPRHTV